MKKKQNRYNKSKKRTKYRSKTKRGIKVRNSNSRKLKKKQIGGNIAVNQFNKSLLANLSNPKASPYMLCLLEYLFNQESLEQICSDKSPVNQKVMGDLPNPYRQSIDLLLSNYISYNERIRECNRRKQDCVDYMSIMILHDFFELPTLKVNTSLYRKMQQNKDIINFKEYKHEKWPKLDLLTMVITSISTNEPITNGKPDYDKYISANNINKMNVLNPLIISKRKNVINYFKNDVISESVSLLYDDTDNNEIINTQFDKLLALDIVNIDNLHTNNLKEKHRYFFELFIKKIIAVKKLILDEIFPTKKTDITPSKIVDYMNF